jgi:hypothetical protein
MEQVSRLSSFKLYDFDQDEEKIIKNQKKII